VLDPPATQVSEITLQGVLAVTQLVPLSSLSHGPMLILSLRLDFGAFVCRKLDLRETSSANCGTELLEPLFGREPLGFPVITHWSISTKSSGGMPASPFLDSDGLPGPTTESVKSKPAVLETVKSKPSQASLLDFVFELLSWNRTLAAKVSTQFLIASASIRAW